MKKFLLINHISWVYVICFFIIIFISVPSCRHRRNQEQTTTDSACDNIVPELIEGYGSEGSYQMKVQSFSNPLWKRKSISVFFPEGASGKRPVIFFSHAYGATDWERAYKSFIHHMVSHGYIVVFSPYPTILADFQERYDTLWNGFELATKEFGDKMDLSKVGFVGHSFGGGATPAMAYKGLVKKRWGKNGAFIFMLAPWYSFQITQEELKQFPKNTIQLIQVYDKDDTNDHRMAIDIYRNTYLPNENKFFLFVRSETINKCEFVADHATPSRNPSQRLKQYAVFRPFDALADYAFNRNKKGYDLLAGFASLSKQANSYQPLALIPQPYPQFSEQSYKFPWENNKNPRRSLEHW